MITQSFDTNIINNNKASNFIDLVPRKFGNQSNDAIKIFIAPALTILLLVLGPLKPFGYHILRFSTASTHNDLFKQKLMKTRDLLHCLNCHCSVYFIRHFFMFGECFYVQWACHIMTRLCFYFSREPWRNVQKLCWWIHRFDC